MLDVEVCGIRLFTLPGSLRHNLDRSVNAPKVSDAVMSAFANKGTHLSAEVLVIRSDSATRGRTKWFLTDRQLVKTYQIEDTGTQLAVSKETQLYLSSGKVSIGEFEMPGPAQAIVLSPSAPPGVSGGAAYALRRRNAAALVLDEIYAWHPTQKQWVLIATARTGMVRYRSNWERKLIAVLATPLTMAIDVVFGVLIIGVHSGLVYY